MYNYILLQWIMAKVTQEWVMSTVPKFISAEQCATILTTPQNPQTNSMEV